MSTINLIILVVSIVLIIFIYKSCNKNKEEGFQNVIPNEVLFGNIETEPIHIWNNNIKNLDIVGKKGSDKPLMIFVPNFNSNIKSDYDNKYFGFSATSSHNKEIMSQNTLQEFESIKAPLAQIKNTHISRRPKNTTGYKSDIVELDELNDIEKTPATWDYIDNKRVEYNNINKFNKVVSFGINHSLIDVIQNSHMDKINKLLGGALSLDINTKNIGNKMKTIISVIKNFKNSNLVKLKTKNHEFGIRYISENEMLNTDYIRGVRALINYYTYHLENKQTPITNVRGSDTFKNTRYSIESNSGIDINNVDSTLALDTIDNYFTNLRKDASDTINRNYNDEISLINTKITKKNFEDEIKSDFKFNYIKMYSEYELNSSYELQPILINPLANTPNYEMIKDKEGNIAYDQLKSISIPFGVTIKLYPVHTNKSRYTWFHIPYYHKDNLIYNIYFKKIFTNKILDSILEFHDNLVCDYKTNSDPEIYKYIYYTNSLIILKNQITSLNNRMTNSNRIDTILKLSALYELAIEYILAIYEEIMRNNYNLDYSDLVNVPPVFLGEPGCNSGENDDTVENFVVGPLAQRNDNGFKNHLLKINELQSSLVTKFSEINSIVNNHERIYGIYKNEEVCKDYLFLPKACKYKDVLYNYNYKEMLQEHEKREGEGNNDLSKYEGTFLQDKHRIEILLQQITDNNNQIEHLKKYKYYNGPLETQSTEGFANRSKQSNQSKPKVEKFTGRNHANNFYNGLNANGVLAKYLAYKNRNESVSKNDKENIELEATAIATAEQDILMKDHNGNVMKILGLKIDYSLERLNVNRLNIYYGHPSKCKKYDEGVGPYDFDEIRYRVSSSTQSNIITKHKFKYMMQKKLLGPKKDILVSYLNINVNNIRNVINRTKSDLNNLKISLQNANLTYKYLSIYEPKKQEMPKYHVNIGQLIQLHDELQGSNKPDFVGYNNTMLRQKFTTIPTYCWLKMREWDTKDIIWEKEFTNGDNSTSSYVAFYKNPYTNTIMISTKKGQGPPNSYVGKIVPCPDKGMQVDRLIEHNKRSTNKCSTYSTIKNKHKLVSNKADDILDEGLEKKIYDGSKQIELLEQRAQELKDENLKANTINREFNKSKLQSYLHEQKKDIDLAMRKLQAGRNKVDINVSYPISIIDNIIDIIANADEMTFEEKKKKIQQLNEIKKDVIYGGGDDYKKQVSKVMKDCPVFDMTGLFKKPVPCYGCNV